MNIQPFSKPLWERWQELTATSAVSSTSIRAAFERLIAAYQTPGRYYHTVDHIGAVLRTIDELANLADDATAGRFAVWFHDAVYDSRANDNEERSADLAREILTEMSLASECERVARLIMATKTHAAVGPDSAVLLDADLAILGSDERDYAVYARQIRQEYAWVPDADYRAGRSRVLTQFLDRQRIYATDRMHVRLEHSARSNMHQELADLRGDDHIRA
jgi:predicted metal-dependent HD superfamily phosphohydrolase